MAFATRIASLLVPALALTGVAVAGAFPPCVKAVSSKNGNFLVLSTLRREPIEGSRFTHTVGVTLEVFPKENFINAKDSVNASAQFWTDWPQWTIVLDSQYGRPIPGCPLSLVSDDGEFLVLLNEGTIIFGDPALRIYRRRDHPGDPVREGPDRGVFIRDIPLREIWPEARLPGHELVTDETPQWFAGGTFDFSENSRVLIHKTRWGNTVRIGLLDGSVWSDSTNLDCFLESPAQPTGSFLCP